MARGKARVAAADCRHAVTRPRVRATPGVLPRPGPEGNTGRTGPRFRGVRVPQPEHVPLLQPRLIMARMTSTEDRTFNLAFTQTVELGNRLGDTDRDADLWDIAD